MFHEGDRFSLARSSLAAVLSQPSTGMLAEEPPATHSWENGTSSVPPPSRAELQAVAAPEGAEPSPSGRLRASQLGHKCHSRSRSCRKSEIIFLLPRCKICPAKVESHIALHWTVMRSEGTAAKGVTLPLLDELLRGRITPYPGCL